MPGVQYRGPRDDRLACKEGKKDGTQQESKVHYSVVVVSSLGSSGGVVSMVTFCS